MIVCIAEKPSVAREIAAVLGANQKRDGFLEGNGYQVTWTFGHLCTLKEPHEYAPQWKYWSLAALPMIPPRFGIRLIDNEGYRKQFACIERLVTTADEVIKLQDQHLKDRVEGGDETHSSALGEMKGRWKRPVSGMKWYRNTKRDFAALPED